MDYIKEFDGLPEALKEWGQVSVSQIKSPEKRHQVAAELRIHIDEMWNENPELDEEKRVYWVLDNLGSADFIAKQLEQEEKYDPYARKRYFKAAIVMIAIGLIISAIGILMLVKSTGVTQSGTHVFPGWYTGRNLGMGLAAGIMILVIGFGVLVLAIRTKK